jgi:siroheme synthase
MGTRSIGGDCLRPDRSRLVARHPAAVIVDASRAEQQVWRGTLDRLAVEELVMDTSGAGTIVIGDVVAIGLKEFGVDSEFHIEALCQ